MRVGQITVAMHMGDGIVAAPTSLLFAVIVLVVQALLLADAGCRRWVPTSRTRR